MATTSNQYLREVVTAIANLKKSFGDSEFILVGGASLICQGSERITADVDILLPGTSVPCIALIVKQSPEVTLRDGVIYTKGVKTEFSVDILQSVVCDKTYEDLEPFTITIFDQIKTLDFPISLGVKIRCWFLRSDSEQGIQKQESDLEDIDFICKEMEKTGRVVDDVVAKVIPISCYNMQLVKDSLEAGNLDRFLAIGGNKFQVPWDEDTEDQRECYTILMADAEDAVDQLEDAVIKEVSGITSGSPRIKRKF